MRSVISTNVLDWIFRRGHLFGTELFFYSVCHKHKYLDTVSEDLDSVDLLDLLGPKPLDFDVIDFDQFGPQPPDLPLSDNHDNEEVEMKVNQYDGIDSPNRKRGAGESHEFMQPEEQITNMDVGNADSGVEQGLSSFTDTV